MIENMFFFLAYSLLEIIDGLYTWLSSVQYHQFTDYTILSSSQQTYLSESRHVISTCLLEDSLEHGLPSGTQTWRAGKSTRNGGFY